MVICHNGMIICHFFFLHLFSADQLGMCNPWDVQFGFRVSRPRCRPDGTYSPKQCSEDGSCWCVDDMGDMIAGSLRADGLLLQCEIGNYEVEN